MASEARTRDYSAPPRTEFEGREFTAEITFCLTDDATDAEVEEWLAYELGGGGLSMKHPLIDAQLNRVEVTRLRRTGRLHYTDWGPTSADGECSGRGRTEYEGRTA